MKKSNIGGQAVLEGVMMKGPRNIAIAVRKDSGEIEIRRERISSVTERYRILKLPVLRGIVNFVETMMLGIRTLTTSAEMYEGGTGVQEEYQPSKFERFVAEKTDRDPEDVMVTFAVVLAIGFAILLFVVLPAFLTNLLKPYVRSPIVMNILEGLVRLSVFLLYITVITQLKDIRRVFQYHGAEHKVIHCYEHEKELTVENARQFTTLHPRCGTSFLLLVMVISILVFSFLGWSGLWWIRVVTRILLLPLVAGIAYEVIKWAGRKESLLVTLVSWPGLMLQKLTTKEPDDGMLEVAIAAFLNVERETDDVASGNESNCGGNAEACPQ